MVNFAGILVFLLDLLNLDIKEDFSSLGGSFVSGAAVVVAVCLVVVGVTTFDFLFADDLASFSSWSFKLLEA